MNGRIAIAVLAAMITGSCGRSRIDRAAAAATGGDPTRGAVAIHRYGCDACHTVPGVAMPHTIVGPSLDGIAARTYIAGQLPNTPANIEQWIRFPRRVNPHTAMPDTGVTDSDAQDIAAFLYTLLP